ncbi:MAG TPA: dihydrofolate reductase, partial [Thermoanaerobaculia bacterium]
MIVSIIVAVSDNNVIGKANRIPWRQSADLKRLKSLTMGHHLLMGRKTFESLERPLPGRTIIVITHDRNFSVDGVLTAPSLERAIEMARLDEEVFIGGGAQIYEQSLHRADRMYLTRVHAEVEGDTFFPEFDDVTEWNLVDVEHCEADERNEYPYS